MERIPITMVKFCGISESAFGEGGACALTGESEIVIIIIMILLNLLMKRKTLLNSKLAFG